MLTAQNCLVVTNHWIRITRISAPPLGRSVEVQFICFGLLYEGGRRVDEDIRDETIPGLSTPNRDEAGFADLIR
jgi:hypothetical protein